MIKINIPKIKLSTLVDNHWNWFNSHLGDTADWFVENKKDWDKSRVTTRQDFLLTVLNLNSVKEIKDIIQADYQKMKDLIGNHPQWTFPRKKGTNYKLRDAIQRAFGYDLFTDASSTTWSALKLFDEFHLKVCPYCNSEIIGKLKDSTGKYNYKTPMDHFFPESKYPVLSCSFFNIIPACTTCNTLKKAFDTYVDEIIYPHLEEYGNDGLFRCRIDLRCFFCSNSRFLQRISRKIDVKIKPPKGKILPPKIKNSKEKFDIDSLYTDFHQDDVQEFIHKCRSSVPIRVKFLAKFGFNKEKILEKLHPIRRLNSYEYPLRKFEEDVLDQIKEFFE